MAVREQAFKLSSADAAVKAATGRVRAARRQFFITVSKTMQADVSTHGEVLACMGRATNGLRPECVKSLPKQGTSAFAGPGKMARYGRSVSHRTAMKKLNRPQDEQGRGRDAVEAEHVLWKKVFGKL